MTLKTSILIRSLSVGALMAGALFSLPAMSADRPALRAVVTVDGPLVTLGDLFEGAGDLADTAVFRAPEPGTSGQVGAARVAAAAARHGLDGIAGMGFDTVTVSRTSRVIDQGEIEHRLSEHLAEAGLSQSAAGTEIRLEGGDRVIHIESAAVEPLAVKSFDHDRRTGRFAAVLTVADSREMGAGVRLSGRAIEVVEVPVLVRAVARGETISSADISITRMARAELRNTAVLAPEDLIGQAARRALRPGMPVTANSVMAPILVGRNDIVTIVYSGPGIMLTARGRSIGSGARGDIVTVINSQSNRTVEAEVVGPGQVTVLPARRPYAALATGN